VEGKPSRGLDGLASSAPSSPRIRVDSVKTLSGHTQGGAYKREAQKKRREARPSAKGNLSKKKIPRSLRGSLHTSIVHTRMAEGANGFKETRRLRQNGRIRTSKLKK